MANNYEKIQELVTAGNKMGLSNTITRDYGMPLDISEIYDSLEAAKKYASTNSIAYQGQIIAVITDNDAQAYIITPKAQADGSFIRPIADLTEINSDIAELKARTEINTARELGSSTDDTYSIKKIDDALYITNKNTEATTTNNLIIDPNSTKIQQVKVVDVDETMLAVGGLISTLKTRPDEIFASLDELREDMAATTAEHVRGTKVQRLFNEGILASGCDYRECNELTSVRNAKGVKFILDDAGNGYVDCAYSVNSVFDVTYAENILKIIRLGDFYFYVVYNDEHFPTGAFCIGRPEGTLTGANYAASWRFFDVDEITEEQLANPTSIPDIDGNTWTMWPRPYTKFAGLDEDFMVTGASWGTGGDFYRLVQVDSRYFIILSRKGTSGAIYNGEGDESGLYCPRIEDYNFSIKEKKGSTNITYYVLAKDYFTVSQAGAPPSPSTILNSFDLLQILAGKGQLVNNVDEFALPSSSANLWGGYWPNKNEFRIGTFDPDISSYDYIDHSGAKAANKLNPAGNYCIGKLESFHPLRMEDGSELYIRTATIKGFKTSMDWPNVSAVAPKDCSLKSGNIWIQYIFAYPVKDTKPRLFYRVLFDGYVKNSEYAGLSGNYRYPWSPCYEIVSADRLEDLKADMQTMFETQISDLNEQIATLQTNITKSAAKDSLVAEYGLLRDTETDGSIQYLTNHLASDLTLSKILAGNRLMLYIAHTDDAMAPNFYCITDRFSLDANKITELDTAGTILKIPAYRVYTTDSNSTRTSGNNNVVFNGGISKVDKATDSEEYTVITANVDNYIAKCTSDTSVTLIIQVVEQGYYKFFVKTSDETQNLLNGISSENNKLYVLA